ncbi:MAG: Lrp/AsnC family transcriptional regulator [Anaerolineales bacterium]|nr:Lrp/AsnC family transcriptional regulator [Anaerolineales bacterium]
MVALQENARISYAELGKQVALSAPAVAERVRKMEEAGIITGYHAAVEVEKLGAAMTVIVEMVVVHEREKAFLTAVLDMPEILQCYNVTGEGSYVLGAAVSSTTHLNDLLIRLARFGQTVTQLVLSKPVKRRTTRAWF